MIDVFAAAKWKRMRILIKMQHLNENMFGDRNYFTVLHYPQNPRMFKLGVSWKAARELQSYDPESLCIDQTSNRSFFQFVSLGRLRRAAAPDERPREGPADRRHG